MQTNGTAGAPDIRARRKAAETRVRVALESIEEAQALLELATQALCSVSNMVDEWNRVGDMHDRVKATWYVVEKCAEALRLRGQLVLDHEPDGHEGRWTALLEGRR